MAYLPGYNVPDICQEFYANDHQLKVTRKGRNQHETP